MATSDMMRLLEELTPLNRMLCSSDLDLALDILSKELPFERRIFRGDPPHNGWVLPPKWDVIEATIKHKGRLIYDGTAHALGVISLSAPFEGRVSLDELKQHLHYDHRYDDVLTFHFRQSFRTWDRDWGFCVTKRMYDALEPGDYDVVIRTRESEGYLGVLEYTLPGERPETFVVSGTTDHPGVANDGLSGVVTGVELFRRLASRPRKFTYRLVLPPSTLGTEFYLARMPHEEKASIMEALCFFMTGSDTQLAMQRSMHRESNLESIIAARLEKEGIDHRIGGFQDIQINDEYIWEAHGIPSCSLQRFPYPEYHTSRDNVSVIRPEKLEEVVNIAERAIFELDSAKLIRRQFQGSVCLSNPVYDLYIDPGQIAFGERIDPDQRKFRLLMDMIPTMRGTTTNIQLARATQLSVAKIDEYLKRWADKGLLEIV